ncbi:MAG: SDR family NAD(P)-dependent oxidoreductase [Gemmatimonadota bacterium]
MSTSPPIAIVGMSSLFAGSRDLAGFWRDIVSATDRLTDVPPHAWLIEDYYDPDPSAPDMTYAKRGGYLDPIPFNPMEFGLPPTTIPATDTAQLIALIAAKRVLEDAGRFGSHADHSRTSVILGVASSTELVVEMGSRLQHPIWRNALREAGLPESRVQEIIQRIKDHYQPWQESTFPGLLGNVVAGRIANRLDLGGSNFVTDAACASSISALQAGLHELYLGDSDMVLAGGVDALNDILMYMCFSKTPAFSATGDCRPFSDEADGTLIGEGVGMVAIRRLEDAERDGDTIYAVIRGLGASSDGKGGSVYAPQPEGQANALRRAYDRAGYSPSTVELVEAHGTATKAGDAAEARGLTSVFGPANEDGGAWCALGSVKSQIGHTKAAAGSAGLIKIALALHHKVLPPTLKVSKPNAQIGMDDSPLYINTQTRPWIRGSDHPRRASVSSFGFGGSNFHVTVEEYSGPGKTAPKLRTWSEELVVLSAPSSAALKTALNGVLEQVDGEYPLGLIAHEAAHAFDAGAEARVAIVADSSEQLADKVRTAVQALDSGRAESLPDPDIHFGFGAADRGKVAFLFPGQGSQYVGMGTGAAVTFDAARSVWDGAADLPAFADDRLDRVVFPAPAFTGDVKKAQQAELTAMHRAQPAIAAVSLGYLALVERMGLTPDAVAGHSFGELSALAAAGRIDRSELLTTARRRGELMAEAAASNEGAMIAVRSGAETVASHLGADSGVVIANDNAPNEVVLAGSVAAIEAMAKQLKDAGLSSIRLPVASAFHSEIVADSCEPFHEHLGSIDWHNSDVDVFANKTAAVYPKTAKAARRLLADQLAEPVRFRDMIEGMHEAGVTHFVEVGPSNVLTKLVGRCLGDRAHVAVALDDKKAHGLRAFWRGLGRLAAEGFQLNLGVLSEGYRVPDAPAEKKPFEIMITGFNHDRPYPPEEGAAGIAPPNPEVPETVEPVVAAPAAPQAAASAPVAPAVPVVTPVAHEAPAQTAGQADPAAMAHVHHVTIEAHRRYQELMADSHRAFLEMAGQALNQVSHGGAVAPVSSAARPASVPQPVAAVPPMVQPAAPAPAPTPPAPVAVEPAEAEPVAAPVPAPAAPAAVAASPAADQAPAVDVTQMALEVVSEKTGYPVDMLDLDMEMEAGLGIDSIKQVEILSELQERLPGLPEIAPAELAELRTLRDVADKLSVGGVVAPAAPAVVAAPSVPAQAPAVDVTQMALEVVSEKTGYPVDMLDLDMEMEAGLGIDSIKQVEILSELQERLPGLPEIAPAELAELRTLRDVADKLSVGGVAAAPVAAASVAQPAAPPTNPGVDVTQMALEVVSEKTGYPVEMLDLDMEMEAGLGIDSIKQVEILSELQERLPGIPEIAPAELAELRTLRDVADKLSVGGVAAPTAAPAAASAAPAAGIDVTALALEVVSEKTGYPVEMLDLDMEMEAGLGIDSIKQVEILSELQERVPGMPEIAPAELAELRTLRDVADKLTVGGAPAPPAAVPTASARADAEPATEDLTALALEVVAEKTGYPVEMLDLDMEMEAGLGIDSIKQVEILSELQERVPGMPEIAPAELAELRTLRDVADKLSGGSAPASPVAPTAPVEEPAPVVEAPAPVAETPAVAVVADPTKISAFVPTIVSELRPGFGLSGLSAGTRVEITNELPALAEALRERLAERGVDAVIVPEASVSARSVICLAALEEVTDAAGSTAVHQRVIQAGRMVAQHPVVEERLFVTVQSTGGDFGLGGDPAGGAWNAGVAGVVKTAAREWPGASVKAIDVADPANAADEIVDELYLGGPALEVGISAEGHRSVVRIDTLPRSGARGPALDPGSVLIVSGGARGVTFSSVAKLAEAWQLKLALLGRSALAEWPEGVPLTTDAVQITGALAAAAKQRGETVDFAGMQKQASSLAASAEVRMNLADLDGRGVETMYLSADVSDAAQVSDAVDHVRQTWGSVDGIVHGAGVLRDKAIADMTPDRVADVFGPKVKGLSVLLEATKEDPIQVIALFSSIAARAGNAGQSAYSAANEVLNKIAASEAQRRGAWCRVRSYNWGPWAGGMVDAGLAAHFEKQGIALLDIDGGAQFFVDELGLEGEGVERVVLAAPSFPAGTHRLTFPAETASEAAGSSPNARLAPAMVADFALRIGQALKPVGSMRMYLEDFVISRPGEETSPTEGGHVVDVQPIEGAIPGYRLVFKDATGETHHETVVRYSENGAAPPPSVPSGGLEPWPFEAEAAYVLLGHTGDHRSIVDLEGVSEEGGMALLRMASNLDWRPKAFARGFDPSTFEGLLQLGELWTHHTSGAREKMASMGQIIVHHLESFPDQLRSAFRARKTERGTLFDFILATEEGDLVAELREVQFDAPSA